MSGLAHHTARELAEMLDSALGFVHQKDALTELVHRAEERDQFKRYHDEIREEYMEAEAERDRLAEELAACQALVSPTRGHLLEYQRKLLREKGTAEAERDWLAKALRLTEGYLSLLFYRAEVNWGHMGVPERTSVSEAISEARAALEENA